MRLRPRPSRGALDEGEHGVDACLRNPALRQAGGILNLHKRGVHKVARARPERGLEALPPKTFQAVRRIRFRVVAVYPLELYARAP